MAEKRKRNDENFTQFFKRVRRDKEEEAEAAIVARSKRIAEKLRDEISGKLEEAILEIPAVDIIQDGKHHILPLKSCFDIEWVNSSSNKHEILKKIGLFLDEMLTMFFDVCIASYMENGKIEIYYSVQFWPMK